MCGGKANELLIIQQGIDVAERNCTVITNQEAEPVSFNESFADLKHLVAALQKPRRAATRREDRDFQSVTLSCTTTSLSFSLLSTQDYPEFVFVRLAFLCKLQEKLCILRAKHIRHELWKVKSSFIFSHMRL